MFSRYPTSYRFDDVKDGLSGTLMVGETIPSHFIWNGMSCLNFPLATTNIPINTMEKDSGTRDGTWPRVSGFKSRHPGGVNFALGDASVHFISANIDYRLFNELGTRAGREVASLP